MSYAFAFLVGLLIVALVLAVRELFGFKPQPEWEDVGKLRDRLLRPIPPTPHRLMAGRSDMVRFCVELRAEFRVAWKLCRLLAPISRDPGYVGRLLMIKVRFNGAFVVAVTLASVGARDAFEKVSEHLREFGGAMRCAALVILDDADLQSSASAA